MQLGFMVRPRSLEETRAVAVAGEEYGFDWIAVADAPTVYQDSYLHQLEIARAAPSVMVGPLVSHVVARHPVIVGNQLATLNTFTGGRAIGTLATGNSAARGLGMKPAKLADLGQAVEAIQGYWRGEGGAFRDTLIPATGMQRDACPLLIAADGPKAAELSGQVGDGLLYGGTLDPAVRRRRLAAMNAGAGVRQAWIAPTVSLAGDHDGVRDDLGTMVVAMTDRALRGNLDERGVPAAVQEDARELRRTGLVSERLTSYLIDSLCIWGSEARWRVTLDALEEEGWTGVMLILGQAEQTSVVAAIGERLRKLGYVAPLAVQ